MFHIPMSSPMIMMMLGFLAWAPAGIEVPAKARTQRTIGRQREYLLCLLMGLPFLHHTAMSYATEICSQSRGPDFISVLTPVLKNPLHNGTRGGSSRC